MTNNAWAIDDVRSNTIRTLGHCAGCECEDCSDARRAVAFTVPEAISLRDQLALKVIDSLWRSAEADYYIGYPEPTAQEAYRQADAMLEARKK